VGSGARVDGCPPGCRRHDRLVTGHHRCRHHRREKGGDRIGRSPINRGKPSTKFHLSVDAKGLPIAVRIGAGNENERGYLLPLIDGLCDGGYHPDTVLADRGYCSEALRQGLRERGITPVISRRRFHTLTAPAPEIPPAPRPRGRRKPRRTRDPNARHRWVIERTNAWLLAFRRIQVRREPDSAHWNAYLTLAILVILTRAL
jgi:transposase